MKQYIGVFCSLLAALAVGAWAADDANPDAILGDWTTDKQETIFNIYKDGDTYNGRIIWLREPVYPAGDPDAGEKKHDRKNPEESKRDVPLLGYVFLKGFTYKDGKWTGGTIYDPLEGKTYKCNMKLEGQTLHVRGYIGVSLLGRTVDWHRPGDALLRDVESTGEKLKQ